MKIEEAISKYEERMFGLPNVIGISLGKNAGSKVIKVYVTHKRTKSSLQSNEIIPNTLEGYSTDVVEIGALTERANV